MKKYLSLLFACAALLCSCNDSIEDNSFSPHCSHLEDMQSAFPSGKDYWNGSDGSGKLQNDFFVYTNSYNAEWDSWYGFALSRSTSTSFDAKNYLTDQYNCCAQRSGSRVFLVGYYSEYNQGEPTIYVTKSKTDSTRRPFYPIQVDYTNSAWTLNTITNGDDYAKKFGSSDYLYLIATGYKDGKETKSLKLPLATNGEVLVNWMPVDLRALGLVDEIRFSMDSSDKGQYGINTPTYFCLDNLYVAFDEEIKE